MFWSKWMKYQRPTFRLSKSGPPPSFELINSCFKKWRSSWERNPFLWSMNLEHAQMPMWVKYWHICRSTAKYYNCNPWLRFCKTQFGMSNLSKSPNHTFQLTSSAHWRSKHDKFESFVAIAQIDLLIIGYCPSGREFYETSWIFNTTSSTNVNLNTKKYLLKINPQKSIILKI